MASWEKHFLKIYESIREEYDSRDEIEISTTEIADLTERSPAAIGSAMRSVEEYDFLEVNDEIANDDISYILDLWDKEVLEEELDLEDSQGDMTEDDLLKDIKDELEPGVDSVESLISGIIAENYNSTRKIADKTAKYRERLEEQGLIIGNPVDGYEVV